MAASHEPQRWSGPSSWTSPLARPSSQLASPAAQRSMKLLVVCTVNAGFSGEPGLCSRWPREKRKVELVRVDLAGWDDPTVRRYALLALLAGLRQHVHAARRHGRPAR